MERLGNRIKRFRFEKNGISQQALADAVNVSRVTINAVENGRFIPSAVLAMKIARFFEAAVEEIFYIIDEEDKSE